MQLKVTIRCRCGKPLKGEVDATYTDKTRIDVNLHPCPRCIKNARSDSHALGMIDRDKQLEAARKRKVTNEKAD